MLHLSLSMIRLSGMPIIVVCLILIHLMSGCAPIDTQATDASGITNVSEMATPSPLVSQTTINSKNSPVSSLRQTNREQYVIQVGDNLDIRFFYNPELNIELPVRPDGRLSLPLIPEIVAVGLSPLELEKELEKAYANELKQSKITVIVRSFSTQKVYVIGEVSRPQAVEKFGNLTVLQAISQCGGISKLGSLNNVKVIRYYPNGQAKVFNLNLQMVLNGTNISQDIPLMVGDIVSVPEIIL